jgi:hypothetical protein
LYHYAGNNPIKYIDPDGRIFDWKRYEEGDDYHFECGYSDLITFTPIFKFEIKDYQTFKSDKNNSYSYYCSGNKDEIEIFNGNLYENVTITGTLKRFNVNLDGTNYDVFSFEGVLTKRFLFSKSNQPLKFIFACADPKNDNYSIYEGCFYRNNFIDILKEVSDSVLLFQSFKVLSFIPGINPITGSITDFVIEELTSKYIDYVNKLLNLESDTLTYKYLKEIVNQE